MFTTGVGSILVVIAGAMDGLFSLGVTRTQRWKWLSAWGLGSLIVLVIVSWTLAWITVPELNQVDHTVPTARLWLVFILGLGWGGGVFWRKAIAAVGIGTGVSLLMAFVNVLGSLLPFGLLRGEKIATAGGIALIGSTFIMLLGITDMARARGETAF